MNEWRSNWGKATQCIASTWTPACHAAFCLGSQLLRPSILAIEIHQFHHEPWVVRRPARAVAVRLPWDAVSALEKNNAWLGTWCYLAKFEKHIYIHIVHSTREESKGNMCIKILYNTNNAICQCPTLGSQAVELIAALRCIQTIVV